MIRTALFNWAYARHTGGTFVFRIEDTDAARDSEESYHLLLDVLRWLGLDWDEGPDIGGPHAPYRQSQRMDLYRDVAHAAARGRSRLRVLLHDRRDRRAQQGRGPAQPGYDNHCRVADRRAARGVPRRGREPVLRLRMPDTPLTWDDLVRGEVTFQPEHVPDFAIVRANGDAALHAGQPGRRRAHGDHPRPARRGPAVLDAAPDRAVRGARRRSASATAATPRFGHLPYVMGEGNKKLSKRDPESNAMLYRERGFLPEGLVNYLALLAGRIGDDIEHLLPRRRWSSAFDVADVNASPARFDLKKCEAINAAWVRRLDPDDLAKRILLHALRARGARAGADRRRAGAASSAATPLVQERMVVLEEAVGMLGFLLRRRR